MPESMKINCQSMDLVKPPNIAPLSKDLSSTKSTKFSNESTPAGPTKPGAGDDALLLAPASSSFSHFP